MYKIVWITHVPLMEVKKKMGLGDFGTGTWFDNLLKCLLATGEYKIYIISPFPGKDFILKNGNAVHYIIDNKLSIYNVGESQFLEKINSLIKSISPDLIHIHGTEKITGLLQRHYGPYAAPIIISIQGLTGPIFKILITRFIYFHKIIIKSKLSYTLKAKWFYLQNQYFYNLLQSGLREKKILKENTLFFGRTDFDRNYIRKMNPSCLYFKEARILRDLFYREKWALSQAEKNSIILTNIRHPAKCAETALIAVGLLIKKFTDIKLRIGGLDKNSAYAQYLLSMASKRGFIKSIEFLGCLSEADTVFWLRKSHIFCLTSLIENSPNTLAEAQMIGMPCIAHDVGGVSSYIEDDCSFIYTKNDPNELASRIESILLDDNVATELGAKAYKVAHDRHDIGYVVQSISTTYKSLIAKSGCAGVI